MGQNLSRQTRQSYCAGSLPAWASSRGCGIPGLWIRMSFLENGVEDEPVWRAGHGAVVATLRTLRKIGSRGWGITQS